MKSVTPVENASIETARRSVAGLFFVDGAALGGYVSHFADIQNHLHISNGGLGRSLLFSAIGAVLTIPMAGPLIHRFGSRTVCLVAGLVLLGVLPFVVLAPQVPALCAVLFLVGVHNGQLDVAMNTHSMAVQNLTKRPIISGFHGWFSIGGFAGGAGTSIAVKLGATPVTHLVIASALLLAILFWGVRGMLPAEVDQDSEGPQFAVPTGPLVLLGVLLLFAFISEGALWDWANIYLRRSLGAAPALASFGFGLASSAMALGRFLGDRWTHNFGYQKTFLVSALLSAAGLLLAVNTSSIIASITGFAIMGLGLANLVPILFRAAASQPGISAGVGLAAVTTCGYSGFLGGPPILGFIADLRSLSFALGLIALLCLAMAVSFRAAARSLDEP
jgi:MFS family permease